MQSQFDNLTPWLRHSNRGLQHDQRAGSLPQLRQHTRHTLQRHPNHGGIPRKVGWITDEFGIEAIALRTLGLRDAGDYEIFEAARKANAVVMTKDSDFLYLLDQHGPPPQVLWITCGNTSNAAMQAILRRELRRALELLVKGERIVEIRR